jgi:hypothetical protein
LSLLGALLLLLPAQLYVLSNLDALIDNGGRHHMLGGVQNQHLLFILLLHLVIVLLGGGRKIRQLGTARGFVPTSLVLVVELRLQERLLVLVAQIWVGHVKGRGLGSVVPGGIHLPSDLRSLEVDQGLLEGRHDVLPRHIILQLLPILLNDESLFAQGLVSHVVEYLVESLVVLLREVRCHLLLMN